MKENVNGYLMRLSRQAFIRSHEKGQIKKSINRLRLLLKRDFRGELDDQFLFGSYARKTILPRFMDEQSDVDYMIVFSDGSYNPQTYLDRLRRFVDANYRSDTRQSHPTIQLELSHIRFELVPAITGGFWSSHPYKIPAKANDFTDWVGTDPGDFQEDLVSTNKKHNNFIKPLVRILKYWNAANGYPFDSFDLERRIVSEVSNSWHVFGKPKAIKSYFYGFIEQLPSSGLAQWKLDVIERAQSTVDTVKRVDRSDDSSEALWHLHKMLPPPW